MSFLTDGRCPEPCRAEQPKCDPSMTSEVPCQLWLFLARGVISFWAVQGVGVQGVTHGYRVWTERSGARCSGPARGSVLRNCCIPVDSAALCKAGFLCTKVAGSEKSLVLAGS